MAKRLRAGDYVKFLQDSIAYGVDDDLVIFEGEILPITKANVLQKQLFIIIENRVYMVRINSKDYKIIPKSQMADLLYDE